MEKAIEIAQESRAEVPIGAVIVKDGKIIASAHNQKESLKDVSAHAEMLAIKKASEVLENWRLEDTELYVTLEPCPMCAWAILQSRIKNVYFGAYDTLYGAFGSKINLKELSPGATSVTGGILEKECNNIIKEFFKERR